jgi:ACT domain-containing protein
MVTNAVGRRSKINIKMIDMIADLISHSYSISDSCRYAGISRTTFYQYLKNEPIFRDKIAIAQEDKNKVSFNFRTLY